MDTNTLFELRRKGLITDEVLAQCLNDIYGKKGLAKSEEEIRQELIAKNKKQAEENRRRVAEYEEKTRKEYLQRQYDEEVAICENFLRKVTNSRGERVYSDSEISRMSSSEILSLSEEIKSRLSEEEINNINSRSVSEDVNDKNVGLYDLLNSSYEKKNSNLTATNDVHTLNELVNEEEKSDEIPFSPIDYFNEEKKDSIIEEPSVIEKVEVEEKPVTVEETNAEPEIEENSVVADVSPEEDMIEPDLGDIDYAKIADNTTSESEDKKVINNYEPDEERKTKFKLQKGTIKSKFLKGLAIVSTVLIAGPVMGLVGIAGYNMLASKIKNGTFVPKNMHQEYLKYNIEKIMNMGMPKEAKGGKTK